MQNVPDIPYHLLMTDFSRSFGDKKCNARYQSNSYVYIIYGNNKT